ncbi:hypothetical protein LWM68_43445 [Niabella sp. W65]|nr:hypothetical protein [Niabella sp. W65]MCH7368989.1 hypothetical protein [Niabella sp. W65]
MRPEKYLRYLFLPNLLELFGTERTKEILSVNPTIIPIREEAATVIINAYVYNKAEIKEYKNISIEEALTLKCNDHIIWINIDGLRKDDGPIGRSIWHTSFTTGRYS